MTQQEKEEIWFARIMMIFGAKAAMDALMNLASVLRYNSGLPSLMTGTEKNGTVATAYLISTTIVAIYLLARGSLFSRLAYGHPAPREYIFTDIGLPDWPHCLAVAFRSLGGYLMILAMSSIALAIAYHQWIPENPLSGTPSPSRIEMIFAFQRIVIGFALLALGGKIVQVILRTKKSDKPEPPQKDQLPADMLDTANYTHADSSGEEGWRISDFPGVLKAATQHRLACIGGQFQFRGPIGTAEMYWLKADSTPRGDKEEWDAYVKRANAEVMTGFEALVQKTDFIKEARDWKHIAEAMDSGRVTDPTQHLYFVAYFKAEK